MRPLSLLMLLTACAPDLEPEEDRLVDHVDHTLSPCIHVSPETLDFGFVAPHSQQRVGEVDLINDCSDSIDPYDEGDLEIYDLAIQDEEAPFEVLELGTVLVPDGESTQATVAFAPRTQGSWATKLLIDTNDPHQPTSSVVLRGDSGVHW